MRLQNKLILSGLLFSLFVAPLAQGISNSLFSKQNLYKKGELGSRNGDSLALVHLYEVTGGTEWKIQWDFNQSLENWEGIHLNSLGRVKCLDFDGDANCNAQKNGGNNMKGEIPDINLPFLEHLFLAGNQLTGTIPDFTSMDNLLTLQLCCNHFTGEIPNFSSLPRLNSLELDYNQLTGDVPNFRNLTELENLYLSNNQLSGGVPSFKNLINLKRIYLHQNKLSGHLADLKTPLLLELLLANNSLKGGLPSFEHLLELRYLNLAENNFEGIIPDLQQLTKIRDINLSNNHFEGAIPVFQKQDDLKTLLLENNQLDKGSKIAKLPALNLVSLKGNSLSFDDLMPYKFWLKDIENYELQSFPISDALVRVELGENEILKLDLEETDKNSKFTWFHNGMPLSIENNKNKLFLEEMVEEDLGEYTCVISNPSFSGLEIKSQKFILEEKTKELSTVEPVLVDDTFTFKYSPEHKYSFDITDNDDLENIEYWDIQLLSRPDQGILRKSEKGEYEYYSLPGFSGKIAFEYEICNIASESLCEVGFVELNIIDDISESDLEFELPGTFLPNLGVAYTIPTLEENPDAFSNSTLSIYNQRGQLVYESSPYINDWKGTYLQSSNPIPMGIYFYRFNWNGKYKGVKTGSLALLR